MSKNILYFIAAAAVLVIVGGIAFYATRQRPSPELQTSPQPLAPQAEQSQGLGSELNQNPGSQVPETNPFKTETNPFEGYKNPFE